MQVAEQRGQSPGSCWRVTRCRGCHVLVADNPDTPQDRGQRQMLDLCTVEGAAAAAIVSWECFLGPVWHLGLERS